METIIEFTISVEGQDMIVKYTPNYAKAHIGHFGLYSPFKPARPIPISETGYRSHFAPMLEIEEFPSPKEYIIALISDYLNKKRTTSLPKNNTGQMSLF